MLRIGQVEVTATSDGKYTDGSVAGGIAATRLRAAALNAIQEELAYIVETAGLTLNVNDTTQVYSALNSILLPVGTPIPWPTPTPPTGWLKCNGATFTAAQYPKLALAYPSLVLPDLRGQFIRGWDDGRGLDSGRTLLSAQTGSIESHSHTVDYVSSATDDGSGPLSSGAGTAGGTITFTTNATGGTETRPRNIAFNYIVRAA